jgi:transcriptional regulator with XRE-family HTH domain
MNQLNSLIGEKRKILGFSQQDIADRLGISKAQYSKIESGQSKLSIDRTVSLAEILHLAPNDIMMCMFSSHITPGRTQTEAAIKVVPVTAQAGFLSGLEDIDESQLDTIQLPLFSGKDLYMIMAEGQSMDPTIQPGTHLIVREIKEKHNVRQNIPYVLVTEDGVVIKRLKDADNPENFALVSDNPEYYPYQVQKASIRSVWNIEGKIVKGWAG